MQLSSLSIRAKLKYNLSLFILFLLFLSCLGLYGAKNIQEMFLNVKNDSVPDIIAILELKSISKRLVAEIQGFIASGDKGEIDEFHDSVILFEDWIAKWKISQHDQEELGLKNEMINHKIVFVSFGKNIFQLKEDQVIFFDEFNRIEHALSKHVTSNYNVNYYSTKVNVYHSFLVKIKLLQLEIYKNLTVLTESEEEKEEENIHVFVNALIATTKQLTASGIDQQLTSMSNELSLISEQLINTNYAIANIIAQVEDHEEEILKTVEALVSLQNQEVQESFNKTIHGIKQLSLFLIIAGGLFIVIAYIFYQLLSKSILAPIAHLTQTMKAVSTGNLSKRAVVQNNDELGTLTEKFNQMTENLQSSKVSKEYVDNILASMGESLIVLNPQGRIESINDATQNMLGFNIGELEGKEIDLILGNESSDTHNLVDKESLLLQVNHNKSIRGLETVYCSKDGRQVTVLFSASTILDNKGTTQGIVCIAADIETIKKTQNSLKESYENLKQAQNQLIQSSKLASIGELAAGIAHELNQPLMIIRTGAQLLDRKHRKGLLDDEHLNKHLDSLHHNSKRMMNIIDHLRTFSRQSSTEFTDINVNKVINDCFYMIGEQLRLKNIEVKKELCTALPNVLGNATQIEQVILNMLTNARDAMLENGIYSGEITEGANTITLSTKISEATPDFVEILIRDCGAGIPEEKRESIFNPFFTTKDIGKGTGLGLSISHGIIKDHNGNIEILETSKNGTTFRIQLPVM